MAAYVALALGCGGEPPRGDEADAGVDLGGADRLDAAPDITEPDDLATPQDMGAADAAADSEPDAGLAPRPRGRIELKMRDGAALVTWIYLPEGTSAAPLFMVRNPYANLNGEEALEEYARFFTSRGMGLVWQAVRGTGGSEGEFVPYLSEEADAHDTMAWLVAQPFSNGRIGVGGGSYLGYTALAAATSPHVKVVIVDDTATDEEMTRHRGVLNGYLLSWWRLVERGELADATLMSRISNALDVGALDEAALGRDLPYWNDVLTRGPAEIYPEAASVRTLASRICAPVLHIMEGETPWNDPRLAWEAVSARSCEGVRDKQWLIVAPESHSYHFNAFGLAETWVTPDMLHMLEAFLLETREAPRWARVRLRTESEGPTIEGDTWPPATEEVSFHLGAPGRSGEGTLGAPGSPGVWVMRSNPAATDPCARATTTWFTSAALATDLELAGAPTLELTARTDAADFDLHVDLYDYLPGAETYQSLGTGAVRARYHTGVERALDGGPMTNELPLTQSARRVKAGHMLTLALSPSRCGYVENPHTGERLDAQTEARSAEVRVSFGAGGARLRIPRLP